MALGKDGFAGSTWGTPGDIPRFGWNGPRLGWPGARARRGAQKSFRFDRESICEESACLKM